MREGSSSFLFLAAESLLQSHTGIIRLFPGVPKDFTGSFERFLAQGAFEVSAAMERGKITRIKIQALRGGTFRLKISPDGNIISRNLKPGESFQRSGKNCLAEL